MKLGALYWNNEYDSLMIVIEEHYDILRSPKNSYTLYDISNNTFDPTWNDYFCVKFLTEWWIPE